MSDLRSKCHPERASDVNVRLPGLKPKLRAKGTYASTTRRMGAGNFFTPTPEPVHRAVDRGDSMDFEAEVMSGFERWALVPRMRLDILTREMEGDSIMPEGKRKGKTHKVAKGEQALLRGCDERTWRILV